MSLQDEILARCPASIAQMLMDRVEETPEGLAFLVPDRAPKGANQWERVSWKDFGTQVVEHAAGLVALGLQPEERVALASSTRYEWILMSLAAQTAAGAVTAIYPNTTDHDVLFIMQDSGSVVLVAENQAQVAKIQLHDDELYDQVRHIILFEDDRTAAERVDQRVLTIDELRQKGRELLDEDPQVIERSIAGIEPDSLATLIYTSGTTGRPKGVELDQRAFTFVAHSMEELDFLTTEDLQYLWLPLSHVFGNCLVAVQLAVGFATAVDGRIDRIVAGLGETKPTIMCGAPRIFEKVRAAVITANPASGMKSKIAQWAFSVGRESHPYRLAGEPMPKALAARYALADRLVFSKLKKTMGGNIRFLISGSAKLSSQVQEWFYSAGITVIEGYGSTETTAIAFLTPPNKPPRFGSVGPVSPGLEVKLDGDGEVLLKGPTIFRGYHEQPEKTAEVFDEDGWFHTGDLGELDADGYLTITDRKRDLMKTSGGKYVAPQKVENAITANIPYVSQAVALGEGRKYIVALVTMERDSLMKWGKKHGHPNASYEELTQLPEIKASIEKLMAKANSRLERWETVKRFAILDHEFSVQDGGVTPSLKVRRAVIAKKYAHIVDSLYDKEA
ncbi:AMP-dependent synthetase/ligase [Luteococcus sp. OSA5]|uniref:AMP-dependent synthetase/ligase n=1 Tax=Luteococcus sp. OSA5 TaxID=3401630 RepID=UPI003B432DEE